MLKKSEIESNINTSWKLSPSKLKEYKYALCKLILDKSCEMNLSKHIVATTMQIVNYFFVKNCYFNYDKLTVVCAAFSLSIKLNSSEKSDINKIFDFYIKNKKDELDPNLHKRNKEIVHNLRNNILNMEIKIMKLFDNLLPAKFPFEYIYLYSKILYPENDDEIYNLSCKICIDSYFTYVNNIYQNYVVALACIFISAKFLDIQNILNKNFKHIDKMKYIHEKNFGENNFINKMYKFIDDPGEVLMEQNGGEDIEKSKEEYFKKLDLGKKLHPLLQMNDLLECIEMISDFYEEMKEKYEKINEKKNKNYI